MMTQKSFFFFLSTSMIFISLVSTSFAIVECPKGYYKCESQLEVKVLKESYGPNQVSRTLIYCGGTTLIKSNGGSDIPYIKSFVMRANKVLAQNNYVCVKQNWRQDQMHYDRIWDTRVPYLQDIEGEGLAVNGRVIKLKRSLAQKIAYFIDGLSENFNSDR